MAESRDKKKNNWFNEIWSDYRRINIGAVIKKRYFWT
jgi:hypothetical protein